MEIVILLVILLHQKNQNRIRYILESPTWIQSKSKSIHFPMFHVTFAPNQTFSIRHHKNKKNFWVSISLVSITKLLIAIVEQITTISVSRRFFLKIPTFEPKNHENLEPKNTPKITKITSKRPQNRGKITEKVLV